MAPLAYFWSLGRDASQGFFELWTVGLQILPPSVIGLKRLLHHDLRLFYNKGASPHKLQRCSLQEWRQQARLWFTRRGVISPPPLGQLHSDVHAQTEQNRAPCIMGYVWRDTTWIHCLFVFGQNVTDRKQLGMWHFLLKRKKKITVTALLSVFFLPSFFVWHFPAQSFPSSQDVQQLSVSRRETFDSAPVQLWMLLWQMTQEQHPEAKNPKSCVSRVAKKLIRTTTSRQTTETATLGCGLKLVFWLLVIGVYASWLLQSSECLCCVHVCERESFAEVVSGCTREKQRTPNTLCPTGPHRKHCFFATEQKKVGSSFGSQAEKSPTSLYKRVCACMCVRVSVGGACACVCVASDIPPLAFWGVDGWNDRVHCGAKWMLQDNCSSVRVAEVA